MPWADQMTGCISSDGLREIATTAVVSFLKLIRLSGGDTEIVTINRELYSCKYNIYNYMNQLNKHTYQANGLNLCFKYKQYQKCFSTFSTTCKNSHSA